MISTIAAYIGYYYLYFFIYASPLILLMFLDTYVGFDIKQWLDEYEFLKIIGGIFFVLLGMVLPILRTKIAGRTYRDSNLGFWEAHKASGVELKTYLCFIPVIGFLFTKKDDPK